MNDHTLMANTEATTRITPNPKIKTTQQRARLPWRDKSLNCAKKGPSSSPKQLIFTFDNDIQLCTFSSNPVRVSMSQIAKISILNFLIRLQKVMLWQEVVTYWLLMVTYVIGNYITHTCVLTYNTDIHTDIFITAQWIPKGISVRPMSKRFGFTRKWKMSQKTEEEDEDRWAFPAISLIDSTGSISACD